MCALASVIPITAASAYVCDQAFWITSCVWKFFVVMATERDTDQRSSYSSHVSSAPSLLSDNMEVEAEENPTTWGSETEVDWQDKYLQLELSLQKFRDQASKIRELLRDKVSVTFGCIYSLLDIYPFCS